MMIFKTKKNIISNFLEKINFNLLKKIFFLVSISYFIYISFLSASDIKFSFEFDNSYLYLSFGCCLLSILFNGMAWRELILWLGKTNNVGNVVSFFILTNSLKYVPGGVWHFIERFNYIKKNTNTNFALYSILLEPYLMLCSSLLMASIGLIYNPIFILLIIPSIFLKKNFIYHILLKLESIKNKSIKLIPITKSKEEFYSQIKIKTVFPFRALITEILFIIFKFLGFIFCFSTFNSEYDISILAVFIIFCFAWSIGLIIPTAPSGIGVFEGCFIFLIGKDYPANFIIISLIYFRLISTSADLFLSIPFFLRKFLKLV